MKRLPKWLAGSVGCFALPVLILLQAAPDQVMPAPNRGPLEPSAFVALPPGWIKPQGWLLKQLQLEAAGFTGHLDELSPFLKKQGSAWHSPKGEGDRGWEELPYWLKGFGDLGYVLGDKRIIAEAKDWIEPVIESQSADGYFGPRSNLTRLDGKPDLWPNMIMLFALRSYYEYSGDHRVIDLMTRYFHWVQSIPDAAFMTPDWQKQRGGDLLASIYWLYNRTGEQTLLDLATRVHNATDNWTAGIASLHGVNFAQGFREPATYYLQSKDLVDRRATDRDLETMMATYGQVPGGMYGADENARPGFTGPRQGTETCAMVEMMLSDEMLLRDEGEGVWADRCENVAYNSLPAAMTPDERALHYLTAPNMVLDDSGDKSPEIQNGGPMLDFDPWDFRCCQHNVSQGWPYFAESLWQATDSGGFAACFFAPCTLKAKLPNGHDLAIDEQTRYPFEETVGMTVHIAAPEKFPLTVRIPGWCRSATVQVNNEKPLHPGAGTFPVLDREWKDGDTVQIDLPMAIRLTVWAQNENSVSVSRGPLTYSLKIGEQFDRIGGTDAWPAFAVKPTTPWNYGLVLDAKAPGDSFQVVHRDWPADDQPFKWDASPIELTVAAKRIDAWQLDSKGLVGPLQASPAKSDDPVEKVELVPMGCARLRISAFPVIGAGKTAHTWIAPKQPTAAQASHCWQADTVAALSDGILPNSSADQTIPRFTWWDHKGTAEWVEYDFPKPITIGHSSVYWFDDEPTNGQCRIPAAWHLEYRSQGNWQPVEKPSAYATEIDKFNDVVFKPVTTDGLRIVAQLKPNFSAGILEWTVK